MIGKRKFDYKWVILAVCTMMTFVCLGFCSSNKGLYLTAITDALGIKRSLFSINDSCRYIAAAIINLFFGTLVAKFGVRVMTGFGFAALIASTLVYAYAENIFVFYIGGILLGIGLAFTTTSMASCIIRRFFKSNIGRYTGIVFAANGIGAAVASQIASPIINEEGNPFGYRNSYLLVAAILLVVGVIAVALLREKPKHDDVSVQTASPKKKARGIIWDGIPYTAVKKRHYFYLAAVVILFNGFILQGITGVYPAHMKQMGLSPELVASFVSLHALALTAAKIIVGILYDRFGLRIVMLICQCSTVAAFIFMTLIGPSSGGIVLAVLFSLLYALGLPLETLAVPLIANDLFGSVDYEKVLGVYISMNYAGYALGAPIVNLCYDILGSYSPILLVLSGLMAVMCIIFQFVVNASNKDKKLILK